MNIHSDIIKKIMEHIKSQKEREENTLILSLKELGAGIGFPDNASHFIGELNATKDINDIFSHTEKANPITLNNEIIKSFNGINDKINDDFYNQITSFIDELNGYELQKTNTHDRLIVGEYNQSNKTMNDWLQRYFVLGKALTLTMKPDPMIEFKLGNEPTFLPRMDIGDDVSNKSNDLFGKFKPSPMVLNSSEDYDVKGTITEDGKKRTIWKVPAV
jgi:hypothetical protein